MKPQLFRVITTDDWKRSLHMARQRRKGAAERFRLALLNSRKAKP